MTLLTALTLSSLAAAQLETTREALTRVEETLNNRRIDGVLSKDLMPAIVVSVKPNFEETKNWYPTAALKTLVRLFTASALRSCEACMAPRVYMEQGHLEQNTSDLSIAEIIRLDETIRQTGAPARTAIWLDENEQGVSLRMVSLENGRLILAENFDSKMTEVEQTTKRTNEARELDRRAKGDSLVHTFFDASLYPGQHISLDWSEQWGPDNANISGMSISLFDPVVGLGINYFRVIPQAFNLMVGAKVLISLPTALAAALSNDITQQLLNPLLNGVLVVRLPISTSNFGIILTASTNAQFGIGISLLNISLLPFLP
jgi:hypothetical protein